MESILEVRVGEEFFGIDTEKIDHILKVPPLTPLSLSSNKIAGVCVILGKVFVVIDLGVVFCNKKTEITETSRIITISNEVALLIDEVLEILPFKEENYEEFGEDYILGYYKNDKVLQILYVDNIFSHVEEFKYEPEKIDVVEEKDQEKEENEKYERFLFFGIKNELMGIDITLIKEIIFVPEITPIADSDALGIINLRNEVLPVIDFSENLGFPKTQITEKSRCLIVSNRNKSIALLVDFVQEEKDIPVNMIEKFDIFEDDKILGIYKGNEVASIIRNEFVRDLIDEFVITESSETEEKRNVEMREVVVFKIENEEYAFNISEVQEIIKYENLTPLPRSSKFIEGLLNLRGSVISKSKVYFWLGCRLCPRPPPKLPPNIELNMSIMSSIF